MLQYAHLNPRRWLGAGLAGGCQYEQASAGVAGGAVRVKPAPVGPRLGTNCH